MVSRASSSLEPSSEDLHACFDALAHPVGVFELVREHAGATLDVVVRYLNRAAVAALVGGEAGGACIAFGGDDLPQRRLAEFLPRLAEEDLAALYARVIDTGETASVESVALGTAWVDLQLSPFGGRVLASWYDVTTRVREQEDLRRANWLLRSVIDASDAAIFVKDVQGRYLLANPVACRAIGRAEPDVLGRTDAELLPEAAAILMEHDREVLGAGRAGAFEETAYVDGRPVTYFTTKSPVFGADGRPYALCGVATDISARKTIEQALVESEERAHARAHEIEVLMNTTPVVIWIAHDPECRTITGSRAAYEVLRVPYGGNMSKSAPAGEQPSHFRVYSDGVELAPEELPVQRAARGEELHGYEEEIVFDDGTRVVLYGSAMPLRARDGSIRGAVSAFVDITARKGVEQAMEDARSSAEAASAAKDQFLAVVSHELRTPLTAVLGYTRMLRTGAVRADRVESVLETIDRNARLQSQLIDDLLDVSRIVTGKLALHLEPVAMVGTVSDAVATVKPSADAKGVEIVVDAPGDAGVVVGDPKRLHQLVLTLLSNAVKFTPAGGRVSVGTVADERSVALVIADTGIGIAPELLPRVFDRFTQGEECLVRQHGGLGLGLAIARHLAEAHGGSIEASSEGVGLGATFKVTLPLRGR
ncbi:MAG: PAS domain-containing protein [Vicinamibacterales bacterium]